MPEPEKTEGTPEPETPDVRAIRQLVRMMKRYDLTAIDFAEGSTQIRLRRRGAELAPPVAYTTHHTYGPASPQGPAVPPPAPTQGLTTPAPVPPAPVGLVIESPMVGTYYASSSPDAPPFVSVGTTLRPDSTVCVIEAMKVFTDIPAGLAGTVTEILVKNGQTVEFGQPLFRITPA